MLKFNKTDRVRSVAETRIDEFFAARVNVILGPMAALHARKRLLVSSGIIEDDGVMEKATAQDVELLSIDAERRALKTKVRAATSSNEIQGILNELR